MFSSPILGKGSIGSQVHYWENVLDSPVHAIQGKSSVGSSVPFHRTSSVKRFYKFPSSILGKDSRFPSPVLGKGSIG